jgi:hypothetical protein
MEALKAKRAKRKAEDCRIGKKVFQVASIFEEEGL